ncbi:hypothetical protein RY27_24725, partial [Litorilinea aerophila]
LFAVYLAVKEDDPRAGFNYLKTELSNYWEVRERLLMLLDYLAGLRQVSHMTHWRKDAEAAHMVATLVRNDHL